jgi:hypothetical protein
MKIRARYTATTITGSAVTLTPKAPVLEDEDQAGSPGLFGTGTIVLTTAVTPDASFWKLRSASGFEYLVEITRLG